MRAVVIVALWATTAAAQPVYRPVYAPPPPSPEARAVDPDEPFLFLAGHLGLGLPVGALGAELGLGVQWFRVSVSAGRSFRGGNVAGMVRAVHQTSGIDFAIGVGLSRGPGLHDFDIALGESSSDPKPDFLTQFGSATRWLDLEASAEIALSAHGFMRFTLGATRAIHLDCVAVPRVGDGPEQPCDGEQLATLRRDNVLPYVGLAWGVRFPEVPRNRQRYRLPQAPPPGF